MPVHPFSLAADDPPGPYTGLELLATAVLLLDEKLEVCYANPAAENLFELSRRQLRGNSARALFGDAPEQAFYVKCDEETNPPEVRALGQVITEIGVAVVEPAEFVIFRLSQWTGPGG